MSISTKIQTLRKQHNLTQEQLADQLNVSRQALSKWELGVSTPEADKIVQLSDYFKVSTDYLLKDSIETHEPSKKGHSSQRLTIILSTAINLIGLVVLFNLWEYYYLGFIIQIIGFSVFELLISRQTLTEHKLTRTLFYGINCWIILFAPYLLVFRFLEKFIFYFIRINNELFRLAFMYGGFIVICLVITLILYNVFKNCYPFNNSN
ncbi:MAG TPA: helix-turn-helix transcriptional regulator [Erysipelotrichaceae bacterium]|nr:helix-turn-helix transcriptional regulator [Erysipelotrichaceae bacterium]